jgi:hypothetical protein
MLLELGDKPPEKLALFKKRKFSHSGTLKRNLRILVLAAAMNHPERLQLDCDVPKRFCSIARGALP